MSVNWAEQELGHARLGDSRRVERAIRLLQAWSEQPEPSIPLASGGAAEVKAAYRFLENDAILPAALIEAHAEATAERVRGQPEVWVAQDTTALNFTAHPATQGLGPLDSIYTRGLKVHSALVFTPEGIPLGLVHQQVWARDPDAVGQRHQRRRRQTAEKESQRWIQTAQQVQSRLPDPVRVWLIGDAESDVYDLFAAPRRAGMDLLVRAAQDRRVQGGEADYLWAAVEASPVQEVHEVEIGRTPRRAPRAAQLSLRFCALELLAPRHARGRSQLPPVPVWAVLVREELPPPGEEPIEWLLLSTRPVQRQAEAWQAVQAYARRWLVERFHFVLKSGCRVEELQLESASNIERALALYMIIAWRLLWLTYAAREEAEAPCTVALDEAEWKTLYLRKHRRSPPPTPPMLGEAVRWVAELGGFVGTRKQQPGVMTLWRGWRRLEDLTQGYLLARNVGNA